MNLADIEKYYDCYNRGDFGTMSERYFDDDLIFEIQGKATLKLDGKKAVIDWFGGLSSMVSEVITHSNVVFAEGKMAVEAESLFTAKVHVPDFMGTSIELKPEESVTIPWGGFYKIKDDKFCHVKLYT